MNNIFIKNKKQKGYAMLFTVIIISAISVITAGLINASYKQMLLSSLAKDSQVAFYQADTASDCALYADRVLSRGVPIEGNLISTGGPWVCGELRLNIISNGPNMDYEIKPIEESSSSPCFRIYVVKKINGSKMDTKITAKGYNVCQLSNPRTVERAIEINYSE